jgi:hypothetical protein
MKPTRQNPKDKRCSSTGEQLSKGDTRMGRILLVAAAIAMLTASGVCAGNFEVLADAGVIKPSAALHIKPGTVMKAEFKSSLRATSDTDLELHNLLPEPVAATDTSGVKAKPAIAFKERSSRGMAPPPKMAEKSEPAQVMAADDTMDLEGDLEKDLVLSPPPAKSEEQAQTEKKSVTERKPAAEKPAVLEKKAEKKKATPTVKQIAPVESNAYAQSPKPIRKVKPITQNPWSNPAGNYAHRYCPADAPCAVPQPVSPVQRRVAVPEYRTNDLYQAHQPGYMTSDPRRAAVRPPQTERYVRDGVTIRLAPAAAPPAMPAEAEEESSGSDILSSAAEIIGLPFAFISSFF